MYAHKAVTYLFHVDEKVHYSERDVSSTHLDFELFAMELWGEHSSVSCRENTVVSAIGRTQ